MISINRCLVSSCYPMIGGLALRTRELITFTVNVNVTTRLTN